LAFGLWPPSLLKKKPIHLLGLYKGSLGRGVKEGRLGTICVPDLPFHPLAKQPVALGDRRGGVGGRVDIEGGGVEG